MRIIQSFWMWPSMKNTKLDSFDRHNGGWIDRRYHYFSWALSCQKLIQLHQEVELYTDSLGKELLINKLQLPYTKVHIVLDEMNKYDQNLWSIGKLFTYSLQRQPFLHVDGDVFIWKKFGDSLLNSALVAQNSEDNFTYYTDSFNEIIREFTDIPPLLRAQTNSKLRLPGINAGILGANDLTFISEYTSIAFDLINNNLKRLVNINVGLFNNLYEQSLFRILADHNQVNIKYLLKDVNDKFDGLVDFTGVPSNNWYVHTIGAYKKRKETGELLEFKLRSEFPDCYYHIISLLKNHYV